MCLHFYPTASSPALAGEVANLAYPICVFHRRSASEPTDTATDDDARRPVGSSGDANDDADSLPARKGRPTPKRSEAEKARKERAKPPLNRREAMRKQRERTRSERARTRQAMASGDERYFLKRDQGPERKFLRDYIDSRRTIGEFFLPVIIVVLVGNFVPSPQVQLFMLTVWLVLMIVLVVDLTILGVRVKREFRKRFPDDRRRGHLFYALMRAMQIRRLRLPKPAVKRGDVV